VENRAFGASAMAIVMGERIADRLHRQLCMPMEVEKCWYYSGTYCALGCCPADAVGGKSARPIGR